jgi:hypothetical protein
MVLERQNETWTFPEAAWNAMACAGVRYKIELVTPLTEGGLQKLDLLGYDAQWTSLTQPPQFVPVLNKERLLKAIVFQKRPYTDSHKFAEKLTPTQLNGIKFMRYKALYMVGGWSISPIDVALRAECERLQNTLKMSHNKDFDLGDYLEFPARDLPALEGMIRDPVVPTFHSLTVLWGADIGETVPDFLTFPSTDDVQTPIPQGDFSWADEVEQLFEEDPPSSWSLKPRLVRAIKNSVQHTTVNRNPAKFDGHTRQYVYSVVKRAIKALRKRVASRKTKYLAMGTQDGEEPRFKGMPIRMFIAALASGSGLSYADIFEVYIPSTRDFKKMEQIPLVGVASDGPTVDFMLVVETARAARDWKERRERAVPASVLSTL